MSKNHSNLNKNEPVDFRKKFRLIICFITVAFGVLLVRLWYLQIIKGDELRKRSENNRIRIQEIKPLRGLIMDTSGKILVDNQSSFDISIIPENTKNVKTVAMKLSDLCDSDSERLNKILDDHRYKKPFVPVKLYKDIERNKLAVVETHSLELPGVIVDIVPVRKYNHGETMAHILGYVGEISLAELERVSYADDYKGNDIIGKYGIEKYFDRNLKGKSGGEQIEVNVTGRKLSVLGRIEPIPGNNLFLTIDTDMQRICWDAFQEKAGVALVMNPRDGAILAMVSKPSFEPSLFNRGISEKEWDSISSDPLSPMQNKSISGQYPPGSTYKLIVAAAALEEGLIKKDTSFYCSGSYTLGDRTYRCWKKTGHGDTNLYQAIVQSCDVYFYNLGEMIGVDKLGEYAQKFGFGEKTGIMLPNEKRGLIPTREWKRKTFNDSWHKGETISLSIGQGFTLVTPIQLLRAYSAIANGGTLYKPRIVKRIETPEGKVIHEFLPEVEAVIPFKKETFNFLQYSLWGAVNDDRGTGKVLQRFERDVCGKTGTAQVVGMPENDEEKENEETSYRFRDHALFACFAPYDNPEIAVLVIAEHAGHGGSTAAPIARKIIDGYFEKKQMETEQVVISESQN